MTTAEVRKVKASDGQSRYEVWYVDPDATDGQHLCVCLCRAMVALLVHGMTLFRDAMRVVDEDRDQ